MLVPYKDLVHLITSDNGLEFVNHEHIAKKIKMLSPIPLILILPL